jgi:hypothetical protein
MMNDQISTPLSWVGSTLLATLVFWTCFGACVIDTAPKNSEPQARIVAGWDPLACGDDPHRVVVELEDDDGRPLSASVPCEIGSVTLDVQHWGVYRGRIYSWALGPEIRSVVPVHIDVDSPVIYWNVETPK